MSEQNDLLNTKVGTKEQELLTAEKVKIESIEIEEVGEKKHKKLKCLVKHPKSNLPLSISAIKFIKKNIVIESGLWINKLDEDKLIQKGSALAVFMKKLEANTPNDIVGKEIETEMDSNGFLIFKGY